MKKETQYLEKQLSICPSIELDETHETVSSALIANLNLTTLAKHVNNLKNTKELINEESAWIKWKDPARNASLHLEPYAEKKNAKSIWKNSAINNFPAAISAVEQ
jgi:hypothetical protein